MKKYIIDTNALISFVTDRNPTQQKKIAKVFEGTAKLKGLVLCPQNVLTEFVFVMDKVYHIPKMDIKTMIGDFIVTPGVEVVHEINLDTLLNLWPKKIPDYGDAIVASLSQNIKGSIVATFDRTFRAALRKLGVPVLSL